MILSPDFSKFIESLNGNDVRYLVVGGYAVALHGHPRYTKDMDVWIGRDEDNAARMIEALEDFGFGSLGLEAGDFLTPDRIIQLGYAPNRIDILTTLAGVEFDVCYESRVEVDLGESAANFINLENLKRNKRASGRYQDLADLEMLP
ncbi:MAG: nucleotidyltransferase domain-containing protein [Rubrobacteraceae bacterium]